MRSLFFVSNVGKVSVGAHSLLNIRGFILVNVLISAKSAGKVSVSFATLLVIREFTQETNPTNVRNVEKPSVEAQVLFSIREYISGKRLLHTMKLREVLIQIAVL